MKPSRFTEEQIIGMLREQEAGRSRPTFAASTVSAVRLSRFSTCETKLMADSPLNLEKSCSEEIVAEARRIIDARLATSASELQKCCHSRPCTESFELTVELRIAAPPHL